MFKKEKKIKTEINKEDRNVNINNRGKGSKQINFIQIIMMFIAISIIVYLFYMSK